jgi:hypothetical protein
MGFDTVADVSAQIDLSTLTPVTFNGSSAVRLQDMITTTMVPKFNNKTPDDKSHDVDCRPLYGYRLVGSDGFSAHISRGGDDLGWDAILLGYLYLDTRDAAFEAGLNLAGMYKTLDIKMIEIYREIRIMLPDTSWLKVLAETVQTTVSSSAAVMLTEIIEGVASPETFSYTITAVDGYTKTLTWAETQTAYINLAIDQVNYTVDMAGAYKVSNVASITANAQ